VERPALGEVGGGGGGEGGGARRNDRRECDGGRDGERGRIGYQIRGEEKRRKRKRRREEGREVE